MTRQTYLRTGVVLLLTALVTLGLLLPASVPLAAATLTPTGTAPLAQTASPVVAAFDAYDPVSGGPFYADREPIVFDASQSTSNAPIASYEWDFDSDGVVDDTGQVVVYTPNTGEMSRYIYLDVTLTVTDVNGAVGTAKFYSPSQTVRINPHWQDRRLTGDIYFACGGFSTQSWDDRMNDKGTPVGEPITVDVVNGNVVVETDFTDVQGSVYYVYAFEAVSSGCSFRDSGNYSPVLTIDATGSGTATVSFPVSTLTDGVGTDRLVIFYAAGSSLGPDVPEWVVVLDSQYNDFGGPVDTEPPVVEVPSESTEPAATGSEITISATIASDASSASASSGTDSLLTASTIATASGASNIVSAEYSLDGGQTWHPMAASDGAFDSPTETVTATIGPFTTATVLEVRIRGTDAAGNVAEAEPFQLAIYDPTGGFVTGGGWIDSPAGAYADDPTLSGKATFGFVAKYKKGAQVPEGNTQFVFHAAEFRFQASEYQWLVVAGPQAQFKGTGTINGGDTAYGFMLTASDSAVNGGGSDDTFRLKVWDLATGDVVYDNGADTPLGGGNVLIHKGK